MTTLDSALDLRTKGLCVVPIPSRSKAPVIAGWEQLRITAEQIPDYFLDGMNIGVHMGEPSKGVVDIDLDHPLALSFADECLPTTGSIFGRESKARSHWLYVCPGAKTRKWQLPAAFARHCGCAAMVAELRATGAQTVCPGSTHPSGEAVRWDVCTAPTKISYDELCAQLQALYDRVYEALMLAHPGWEPPAPRPSQVRPITTSGDRYALAALKKECDLVAGCADGTGNDTVFTAGLKMGGLIAAGALDENEVYRCLTDALSTWTWRDPGDRERMLRSMRSGIEAGKSKPRQLPERSSNDRGSGRSGDDRGRNGGSGNIAGGGDHNDIVGKEEPTGRGGVSRTDSAGSVGDVSGAPVHRASVHHGEVGGGAGGDGVGAPFDLADPAILGERFEGRLILSKTDFHPTARAYIRDFYTHPDAMTLRSYAGCLFEWRGNRYRPINDGTVECHLHDWLHEARRVVVRKGTPLPVQYEVNNAVMANSVKAIHARTHLPDSVTSPSYLSPQRHPHPANELIPCLTKTLHVPTGSLLDPTPSLFNFNALDFDPDPQAPPPVRWLAFLDQVFGPDAQSIELLQDWFGYCLTGDTSQQKMLLMIGAKRSGKGTIGRILRRLVGDDNTCGPTTNSLSGPFGLQSLIGKSIAIVSDARFKGEHVAQVVEHLLCISGEDALTIDRKFLGSVTMKLPTRFVFLTNEVPKLSDASSAIASRFLILRFERSFYNQEDHGLGDALCRELPGILNWALAGWTRLRARGRFSQPAAALEMIETLEDLASPVAAFVREKCDPCLGGKTPSNDLYLAYLAWLKDDGRDGAPSKKTFGRDLCAAAPYIKVKKGTADIRYAHGIVLKTPIDTQSVHLHEPDIGF